MVPLRFLGTTDRGEQGLTFRYAIYHRSLTFEHFVPWFAVYGIDAAATDQPMIVVKAHPSDGTRLHRHLGRFGGGYEGQFLPFVAVRAYWLRGNTVRAYRALGHYFRHPDRRPELGTSAPLHPFATE